MKALLRRMWDAPTGPWLAVGMLLANTAAAIPFGVSNMAPGSPPDDYEWFITSLFAATVVMYLLSYNHLKVRSWVASISGGLWFGTAVSGLFAYHDDLDAATMSALVLFPLGLSAASFALARVADIEKQVRKDEEQ